MGNSASTHPQTNSTDKRQGSDKGYDNGEQQSSEQINTSSPVLFQLSITKPTTTTVAVSHITGESAADITPMSNQQNSPSSGWTNMSSLSENITVEPRTCATIPVETIASSPRSVPGRIGWISNTGESSPRCSSSTSPRHKRYHRQSVSGPYYRARDMSFIQQPPQDDNLSSSPPGHQFQQLQLNSYTQSDNLTQTPRIPTVITWSQGGKTVHVTGTFNNWKHPIKLVKSTHDFNTILDLAPGTHRLKFIVDDTWRCSRDMETATDPDGNLVNYLQVLENDDTYSSLPDDEPVPLQEEYASIIPTDLLLISKGKGLQDWPPPPDLPPHLETALLNTVLDEDNSILPVPNHVTLNHLYARSIKDHIMALSTTTRYRKKYVTTMYYKPV